MGVSLHFGKKSEEDKSLEYLDKVEPGPGDPWGCQDEGCPQHGTSHVHLKLSEEGQKVTLKSPAGYSIEEKPHDPAKALLQAVFPPKGMAVITPENWMNFTASWDVENEWWTPYLMDEVNGVISSIFTMFQKSAAESFTKWCQIDLHKAVVEGNFGPMPVQVLDVQMKGMETGVTLKVGPATLIMHEWVANEMKSKKKS